MDFCAGIGGGRLGLEQNGFKCVGFSEINDKSISTYRSFFGDAETNFGDLTKINYENLPNFDILIAGFPCQSFSINGKRKGFKDERGQIIFYLAEILKNKNIKYFIFENVKGLININNGEDFRYILKILNDIGFNVSYKVLNTLNFSLPQSRERVYFVGIKKNLKNNNFIFPELKFEISNLKEYLIDDRKEYIIEKNSERWDTLMKQINNKYNKGKFDINKLLNKNLLIIDTRQSDLRLYEGYIPTLRTGRSGICYVKDGKLRRLSAKESLLLQGFPKKYYDKIKDTSDSIILEQTGNAMSVNVVSFIASQLCKIIN